MKTDYTKYDNDILEDFQKDIDELCDILEKLKPKRRRLFIYKLVEEIENGI